MQQLDQPASEPPRAPLSAIRSRALPRRLLRRALGLGNPAADKDQVLESRLFNRRAAVSLLFVAAALITLFGRLIYLQVYAHQQLTTLSEKNRVSWEPLPPTRGLIFDRNGIKLADNLTSSRLEVTPEISNDLALTFEQLRDHVAISDGAIERFRKLRRHRPPYSGVPLKFRLTESEVNGLAVELHRFPSVAIKAGLTRHYPFSQLTSHLVGYVGRIDEREMQTIDIGQYRGTSHIGKIGIEKFYEKLLHGEVGFQQVETNAKGRILRVVERQPPVAGSNLYLSIDIRLQRVAEAALGDYTGSIVAMDPRNGEVLAMVSRPGYDPNLFVNGIDVASYRALNDSAEQPLFNRALMGTYPPGSTIKPFIGLAGLESRTIARGRKIRCLGKYRIPRSQPQISRLATAGPRLHPHEQGNQSVVRCLLLRSGAAPRHRSHPRSPGPFRVWPAHWN